MSIGSGIVFVTTYVALSESDDFEENFVIIYYMPMAIFYVVYVYFLGLHFPKMIKIILQKAVVYLQIDINTW